MDSTTSPADVGAYIRGLMETEKPISTVLRDLKSGKLKHTDVYKYFEKTHRPIVAGMVSKFQAGNLFAAQRQNLGDWLAGKDYPRDNQVWLDLRAELDMAQMKESDVSRLAQFYYARIASPSLAERKRVLEEDGSPGFARYRERWGRRNQQEGWTWTA